MMLDKVRQYPPATDVLADQDVPADTAARVRVAARATTPASILTALASDPEATVRAAVALNPVSSMAADTMLALDMDERIRVLLAGKMSRLLPGLSGNEQSVALSHVHTMLRTLANDAAVRVRVAIAQALTTIVTAPRDIILKLAHDPAIDVSDPVVRFSPLLTDLDLLELLATPPHPATAVAVASRAGLSAVVATAIADHASTAAVSALLSNRTASIQEATLDSLIGRAGEHPEWHEPLTCRPLLPLRAIRTLSMMVAGHLLDVLADRADLPPGLAEELRSQVTNGLQERPAQTETEMLDSVRQLNEAGKLKEIDFLDAALAGDSRRAAVILAVASGVPLQTVDRAVALRSPKALVSLISQAGFTMRAGCVAQNVLARLSPAETLAATSDEDFPLSASEMDWQIELLGQPASDLR